MSEVKIVSWGDNSVQRTCPRCQHFGNTKIQYRIGCCTWTWVIGLILSGICLPCSWFPCALNCTKDTLHICTKCLYILGRVPRNPCTKKTVDDLLTPDVVVSAENENLDEDLLKEEIIPEDNISVKENTIPQDESVSPKEDSIPKVQIHSKEEIIPGEEILLGGKSFAGITIFQKENDNTLKDQSILKEKSGVDDWIHTKDIKAPQEWIITNEKEKIDDRLLPEKSVPSNQETDTQSLIGFTEKVIADISKDTNIDIPSNDTPVSDIEKRQSIKSHFKIMDNAKIKIKFDNKAKLVESR